MTYYAELRRTVERTHPLRYVPLEELAGRTGFRSVYGVDEALRDLILRQGNVKNLSDLPVYSDCLFVDFDNTKGVFEFQELLVLQDIAFDVYTTGRRGVHFHVAIEPMFGPTVPESQLKWMQEHATGGWDHTVYRHHSIIRLPGTWHEKAPGQRKDKIGSSEGGKLVIPLVAREARAAPMLPDAGDRNEADFWSALLVSQNEPGRTFRLYHLGALAHECGVPYHTGLEAVMSWAASMAVPPLANEREVRRAFTNGFEKD